MGKSTPQEQRPTPRRNEPSYAETSSMADAHLLDDVDSFPDEELPAYEDTPSQSDIAPPLPPDRTHGYYDLPDDIPFSSHDLSYSEIRTRFPNFSTSADNLYQMIKEQAACPPSYFVELHGTSSRTIRDGDKKTTKTVTDFNFRINITYLLGPKGTGALRLLPSNKRGYRGTRFPRLTPTVTDLEGTDDLRLWCEKYVADPSKLKSFILSRKVVNHDTKTLEQLIRSAVTATNYRGHLQVTFPKQYKKVIVYSPGKINEWRITTWIRWLFYLTFLWVISWPILFFATSRYQVVDSVWEYADTENSNDPCRRCRVLSETQWFMRWERSIQRAAFARMNCPNTPLDERYREATLREDQERRRNGGRLDIPATGNSYGDAVLNVLGGGLRIGAGYSTRHGWGGDDE